VAKILRGKNKPSYTPHTNCGDYVIVINADKVKLTGAKMTDKVYTRYTGFPGGQRFATPADFLTTD
jgi:large subunit ribosomal protein L13